jgi:hypothetical protein
MSVSLVRLDCTLLQHFAYYTVSVGRGSFLVLFLDFLAAPLVQVSSLNDFFYTFAAPVDWEFLMHIGFSSLLAYPCLISFFWIPFVFASLASYSIFILF